MTDETNIPDETQAAPVVDAAPAQVVAPAAEVEAKPKKVIRHQRNKQEMNTLAAELQTETVVTDDEADDLPASVTLAAPYAFYDDEGVYKSWAAGQVVVDAAEIAILVTRGAIFEVE